MKKINYLLEFILIKILFVFFQLIGYRLSSNLGFFIGRTIGPIFRSKKMIIQNLKKANIQDSNNLTKLASNVLGNYGRIFAEYVYLKKFRNNDLKKYVTIDGLEHLENLKKNNKKAVFISGHFNNFELMAMEIEKAGINLATIYRPLNNFFLNPLMEYLRKKYVCRNQIKKGINGVRESIQYIKNNYSIALMIDQRVSEGELINFFDKPALTTTLPAQLAMKYDLAIIPVSIKRIENDKFKIQYLDEIKAKNFKDKLELTKELNKVLEEMIIKNPGQWIWTHNRWK